MTDEELRIISMERHGKRYTSRALQAQRALWGRSHCGNPRISKDGNSSSKRYTIGDDYMDGDDNR